VHLRAGEPRIDAFLGTGELAVDALELLGHDLAQRVLPQEVDKR
jgi:hypothetical protein